MPSRKQAAAAFSVALLAVLLRLPSGSDSFWVDELHSAWTIHDTFAVVAERAAAGNQFPLYFWSLWLWSVIVGSSEMGLRLSSMLLTGLASGLFVLAAPNRCRVPVAGLIAGLFLACQWHALFFGTELRPYAAILLCSTLQSVCLWRLIDGGSGRWFAGLVVAMTTAALLQPATLTVLLLLPLFAALTWWTRPLFSLRQIATLLLSTLIPIALCYPITARLWTMRGQWTAFAIPRSAGDLWTLWPWPTLVLIPAAAVAIASLYRQWRGVKGQGGQRAATRRDNLRLAHLLVGTVAMAALLHWTAAWFDWIPLWHRRYLIAGLPMLCLAAGLYWQTTGLQGRAVGVAAFTFLLPTFVAHPTYPVIRRGEDWRGAVAFINAHRQPDEPLFVAAQLIESHGLASPPQDPVTASERALHRYLLFPVEGPYAAENATPLAAAAQDWAEALQRADSAWLIVRVPASAASVRTVVDRLRGSSRAVQLQAFGNVTVLSARANHVDRADAAAD